MPIMPHIDATGYPVWAKAILAGVYLVFAVIMFAGAYQLWKRSK